MYDNPGLALTGASAAMAFFWYPMMIITLVFLGIALWRMWGTLGVTDQS